MKKKIQKKYAGGTLLKLYMCLICFGQATPYCIIAGCSKRYDVTTHRQGSEQLSKKTAMDSNGGSTLVPTLIPAPADKTATKIQKAYRRHVAQKKSAATTIQRVVEGHNIRTAAEKRVEKDRLGACAELFTTAETERATRERAGAAIKIQAAIREHQVRTAAKKREEGILGACAKSFTKAETEAERAEDKRKEEIQTNGNFHAPPSVLSTHKKDSNSSLNTTSGIVKKGPQNDQENALDVPRNKIAPQKAEDCLKELPEQAIQKENEVGEAQKKSASQKYEALKPIIQQFIEVASLKKKRLEKLRNGQKSSNKKSGNANQAAYSEKITRLKEKKKLKEELWIRVLEKEKSISRDVPKEAQGGTGIQTIATRQDHTATKVIKIDRKDNTEPGWESDIEKYIEVSPGKGGRLLKEIFVNGGSTIEKNNEAKEQENVTCLTQCLLKKVRAKEQSFDDGTYIIEDPEKLFLTS